MSDRPEAQNAQGGAPQAARAAARRGARRRGILSACLGIASILCVMLHFFISPLNIRLRMAGAYDGNFLALLPMSLAAAAVLAAVRARRLPALSGEGFAVVGLTSGIIGLVFGTVQLFTCTVCVQLDLFGLNLQ